MSDAPVNTQETFKLTPAQEKARKRRGLYLALALFGFIILVFVITLVRLGENASKAAESRNFSSAVEYFADDGSKLSPTGEVLEEAPATIAAPTETTEEAAQ